MSATKITGGKVTYGLTVCPKQYESKRADVELVFGVGEDDSYEEIFDKASRAVINRARQMCDLPVLSAAKDHKVEDRSKFEEPKATTPATKTEPAKGAGLFE